MKKYTSLEHTIKKVVAEQNYRNEPVDEAIGEIGTDKPKGVPNAFFKPVHIHPRKGDDQIQAGGPIRARRNTEMERAGVHKEEAEIEEDIKTKVLGTAVKEIGDLGKNIFNFAKPAPTGNLPAIVTSKAPKPSKLPKIEPEPKPFAEPSAPPKPAELPIGPEPKVPAPLKPETVPKVKPEVKPETLPQVKPEVKPETVPKVKPEVKPESLPQVKPEVKTEVKPETKTEVLPAPSTTPKTQTEPETKTDTKTKTDDKLKIPDFGIGGGSSSDVTSPSAAFAKVPVVSRIAIPNKRKQAHFEETRYDIKNVARPKDNREDSIVGRPKDSKSKYTKQAEIIRKVVEEKKIVINKKKEEKLGKNPLVDTEPKLTYNSLDVGPKDVK